MSISTFSRLGAYCRPNRRAMKAWARTYCQASSSRRFKVTLRCRGGNLIYSRERPHPKARDRAGAETLVRRSLPVQYAAYRARSPAGFQGQIADSDMSRFTAPSPFNQWLSGPVLTAQAGLKPAKWCLEVAPVGFSSTHKTPNTKGPP